ncbi:hypothetical protein BT93_F3135 [Corymbia citriodora subsp. variegata]|nr:hypothetical protein BT93_F3135 [Corymbia citriodora subsp. variegata]
MNQICFPENRISTHLAATSSFPDISLPPANFTYQIFVLMSLFPREIVWRTANSNGSSIGDGRIPLEEEGQAAADSSTTTATLMNKSGNLRPSISTVQLAIRTKFQTAKKKIARNRSTEELKIN